MREKQSDSQDLIYGTRAVMEAIRAGKEFERLYLQKNLNNELITELQDLLKKSHVQYSKVPVEKLNRITRKNHQGVVGHISPIAYASLDNIISSVYEKGQDPFLVILDRITDVRNFGAIARTAESAGAHALVVPYKGSAQISSDAIKTSAGALNHLPVCRENNLGTTIKNLQDNGLFVIACTEKTNTSIYEYDFNRPLAIVVGSEEDGISTEYIRKADALGMLPMKGKISSLNVSVAVGVITYEVVRQRAL